MYQNKKTMPSLSFVTSEEHIDNLKQYIYYPKIIGIVTIFLFFGIFGTWASCAKLDGSVMATGIVTPISRKQIVQHKEGGKIKDILVKNGDIVSKGQSLIILDNVAIKLHLQILNEMLVSFLTNKDKLNAQYNNLEAITFDKEIDHIIKKYNISSNIINDQQQIFINHRNLLSNQLELIQNHIKQLENNLVIMEAKSKNITNQKEVFTAQSYRKKTLFQQGYIDKQEFEKHQLQKIASETELEEINTSILNIKTQINEKKLEIEKITIENQYKLSTAIHENNKKIEEIYNQIKTYEDLLDNTTIISPITGIVSSLEYNNIGGVISPISPIMEIVPVEDNMMIEAQISPQNLEEILTANKKENHVTIDNFTGVPVKVRFTSFNARKIGMINGILTYVSANAYNNDKGSFYNAHIMIPDYEKHKIENIAPIYPGMPVIAFIKYNSRTLLEYLLSPLTSSMQKSLNEK